MKIIITTPLYPPEIAEPAPYVKELSTRLKDKHELVILTYANTKITTENPRVISIIKKQPAFLRISKYFFTLLKLAKNCDFIYAQNGISSSLPSALVGLWRRKPVIFRNSEDESWERASRLGFGGRDLENFLKMEIPNFKIRLIRSIQVYVLRKSKIIIAPSLYFKNIISNFYNIADEKILVNYNPPAKEIILPFPGNKISGQIIAFGEYLSADNLNILCASFLLLKTEFPFLKLIITGEVKNEKFKKSEGINWIGVPGEAERQYLLKTSEIFIHNTSYKNNPDIIFSAFAAGTIVICSRLDGPGEVIEDNKNGLLIDARDGDDIKNKIKTILNDDKLKIKLLNEAKNVLRQKFSWEKHLNNFQNILDGQK